MLSKKVLHICINIKTKKLKQSIKDLVLIDTLHLTVEEGFNVLTGETGAGKSILLDALGLALGMRGDVSLVRQGAEQAVVSAEFCLKGNPQAAQIADAIRSTYCRHDFKGKLQNTWKSGCLSHFAVF